MPTRIWQGLIVLLVCLGLPASYASAQGKGHGHGGGKDKDKGERVERDYDRDDAREHRLRHEREEIAERHVHKGPGHVELGHIFPAREPDRRPPGWDKGKKVGWGDCDVPPGQAKKIGCRPVYVHQRRVRRPVVVATTRTTTTTTATARPRPRLPITTQHPSNQVRPTDTKPTSAGTVRPNPARQPDQR